MSYSITVRNQSGKPSKYFIFGEPPRVAGNAKVLSSAFAVSDRVQPETGAANFKIDKSIFAICGTVEQGLNVNSTISSYDARSITLGGTGKKATILPLNIDDDGINFGSPQESEDGSLSGSFRIIAPSFESDDGQRFYIGIGAKDYYGDVKPLSVFRPTANSSITITPTKKFWICAGQQTSGAIIDVSSIGEALAIDFAVQGSNVHVVHTADNDIIIQ